MLSSLQLVDGHTLFDYNVGLNEIIQILVRKPAATAVTNIDEAKQSEATSEEETALTASENVSVRFNR